MESEPGQLPWDQLIEIGTMVASMIDDVMAAYQEGDLETAQAIRNSDLHVDKLHTNIFRHVIEQMDEGKISALNGARIFSSLPRISSGWATSPPASPNRSCLSKPG